MQLALVCALASACASAPRQIVVPRLTPPLVIRQMVEGPRGFCTLRTERNGRQGRVDCWRFRQDGRIIARPEVNRADVIELSVAGDQLCFVTANGERFGCSEGTRAGGQKAVRLSEDQFEVRCPNESRDDRVFQTRLAGATGISAAECTVCGVTGAGVLCRHGGYPRGWQSPLSIPIPSGDEPVGWLRDPAYQRVLVGGFGVGCAATETEVDCWDTTPARWSQSRPVVFEDARALATGSHFVCGLGRDHRVRCVGAGFYPVGEEVPALRGAVQIGAGEHTLCGLLKDRIDCVERSLSEHGPQWRTLPPMELSGQGQVVLAQVRNRSVLVAIADQLFEYETPYPDHRPPIVQGRPWLLQAGPKIPRWERHERFRGRSVSPDRCVISRQRNVLCASQEERQQAAAQDPEYSTIAMVVGRYVVLANGELWRLRYTGGPDGGAIIASLLMPLFMPFVLSARQRLVGAAPVKEFEGIEVASVTSGRDRMCVITPAGVVICLGDNYSGEVTGAPTHIRKLPYQHSFDQKATALSLGEHHTCALFASGAVRCWGRFGATPIRPPDDFPEPARVEWPEPFYEIRTAQD
jgi:hypothetical protein